MKIIDIAICVNNKDPENLGRIRCIRYSSYTGEIEKALPYIEWDDKDLFTANPFLPTNINFIPEPGQTVKILNYNTNKETVNTEYIAGPFTTRHDFNSQTHAGQVEKTSYGTAAKHGKSVVDKDGNPKSEGVFAKHTDYGVYGKYGSDIIFTEDGLQLRGGKLITKKSATSSQKINMLYQPIKSKNTAVLYLKKFEMAKEYVEVITSSLKTQSADLKYIVEYSIDDFNGGIAEVSYRIFHITKTNGELFKTYNPSLSESKLVEGNYTLINLDGTTGITGTPTFTREVTNVIDAYTTIREDLKTLHYKGLSGIDTRYNKEGLHPFYFRPSKESNEIILDTNTENENRKKIFNNIYINEKCGPQDGLVFMSTSTSPPVIPVPKKELVLKEKTGGGEQTFSALKSDKIYFLSTDNKIKRDPAINFESLDKYELTQDNYLKDIEPKTYATVRGDILLNFLKAMYKVLISHKHGINKEYAKTAYDEHNTLLKLYEKLDVEILNKSIRIN
jgi:hypothetical protein